MLRCNYMLYFADSTANTIGWLQIVVPAAIGLVTGVGGTWATLAQYREKVDQLEKIDGQKRLSTLEGQFTALQNQLSILQQNSPTNYVQSHSPMKLTENGESLLERSGMKKYIDDNFNNLYAEIQNRLSDKGNDYSAYDVQEVATEVIKAQADGKDFIPIKDFAFAEGLVLDNIQLVGGIYLRNKALENLGFDMDAYYSSDDDGHAHKPKK